MGIGWNWLYDPMGIGGAVANGVSGHGDDISGVLTGGGSYDYKAQKEANDVNVGMAREQMQFQERMSNSAYQRGMMDMEKAGLNPMLAFSQGGASSPSGAMAQVSPASKGRIVKGTADAIEQAFGAATGSAKSWNDINNVKADTNLKETANDEKKVNMENTAADTALKVIQAKTEAHRRDKERFSAKSAEADAKVSARHGEIAAAREATDKQLAVFDAWLERIEQAGGAVGNAVRALFHGGKGAGSYHRGRANGYTEGYERGTRAGSAVQR